MTKFFFKLKTPYFWPISPILGAKEVDPATQIFIAISSTMPKFKDI